MGKLITREQQVENTWDLSSIFLKVTKPLTKLLNLLSLN